MPSLRPVAAAIFAAAVTAIPLAGQSPAPAAPPPSAKPAVVVLVMVDQFRADYVDKYGGRWTKGLRRLIDTGAYFRDAAYPYASTETCPGHATVATGSFPRTHGIIANGWYDRAAEKAIVCTADATQPVAIGGGNAYESHGVQRLRVPTLADELRAQAPGGARVIALSLKARASIMMAGHAGNTVAWLEDSGSWATSTTYAKSPDRAVDAFVRAHPIEPDESRVWTLLRPASTYAFDDDGLAEQVPDGWTAKFPHSLARPAGVDRIFYDNWRRTPFADQYLGRMAASISRDLGHRQGIDLLALSFSALDYVGHRFGPSSIEVQDTLARLDVTLGTLFDALDASVGRGRYVVAMTSDHGVAPLPEQSAAAGVDAGRTIVAGIQPALDAALTPALGAGPHFLRGSELAGNASTDVYFTKDVLDALAARPDLRRSVVNAAVKVPGIARAIWATELAQQDDAESRAILASFNADRNGDLLLVPKAYWVAASGGTGHGTSFDYDRRVPIMLMGSGVKPGRYSEPVTPADIAPTLAYLAGITLARPDGRVLSSALRR